jgi:hypothetical protein
MPEHEQNQEPIGLSSGEPQLLLHTDMEENEQAKPPESIVPTEPLVNPESTDALAILNAILGVKNDG